MSRVRVTCPDLRSPLSMINGSLLGYLQHGNWINKANTDFYPCWFWQDWSKFSTLLKAYRYLFLEQTQHYSSVFQEFNLDVEETQTFWLGIWLMNIDKTWSQIMMSRNCQFSSIEFDRLCQLSQSSFCQIKLSIILVSCKIGQKHPPFIVKVAYCETDTQWENGNGQCQKSSWIASFLLRDETR